MKRLYLVGLLATLPVVSYAQVSPAPAPLAATRVDARKIADTLGDLLTTNYVYADTGNRYAAMLRQKAAAGGYDGLEPKALARNLTEDLQAVAKDAHLKIFAPGDAAPMRRVMGGTSEAIGAARWIADGVAYLRLNFMPGNPEAMDALEKFFREHAEAKTLIIDNRSNPGGSGGSADVMMSYFFDAPKPLLQMEMRTEPYSAGFAPFQEGPTVRRIAAPQGYVRWERAIQPNRTERRLQDAQIFYLTSKRTASSAEAMALALKRTKRAVLIGENSYGAGHFTRPLELGQGYSVNLPIGRTFDPDTGEGFEGTGVVPDVAVPAAQALEEALRRAGLDSAKIVEAVRLAA